MKFYYICSKSCSKSVFYKIFVCKCYYMFYPNLFNSFNYKLKICTFLPFNSVQHMKYFLFLSCDYFLKGADLIMYYL